MGVSEQFPWEQPAPLSTEETVAALQRDFAYAVAFTAIMVHSSNPAFRFVANTQRGQLMPRGEVKFSDGTTIELQDIGMCQPNVEQMTVREIFARILQISTELGLELVK